MLREVVEIDEALCDGCGLCIPACHEGALRIVNGKAQLVSDRLCDGLGACLGHCPRGAIRILRREAPAFDEAAVQAQREAEADRQRRSGPPRPHARAAPAAATPPADHGGGCPGSRFMRLAPSDQVRAATPRARADERPAEPSALSHWPVQLRLLSPNAPVLNGARLLVAADCVPVAYREFHADLLRDHAVVIACPKLDDPRGYVEKLAEMISANALADITVVHMEVPCCTGLLHLVLEARQRAGSAVPVEDMVIGIRGELVGRGPVPAATMTSA